MKIAVLRRVWAILCYISLTTGLWLLDKILAPCYGQTLDIRFL